jgi:uncharacterized membrane protein YgdD (TMEM256/DUF423 family)
MMNELFFNRLLRSAAMMGMLGVAVGAFGAHFLAERLDARSIDILRTGTLYLFIHTLALMAVVIMGRQDAPNQKLKSSGLFFVIGIILFSGSLFLIATSHLTNLSPSYYGFITPVGGLFFIAGWLMLFLSTFRTR